MWIFNFFPTWVSYVIAGGGLVGFVLSIIMGLLSRWIPKLIPAKIILQLLSIAAMILGVYLIGGTINEEKWEARVKEMETRAVIAEQKAILVNTKIQYKFIDRIKVVKEKQVVVEEKIKEVEKILDAKCEVPKEAVDILNQAAKSLVSIEKSNEPVPLFLTPSKDKN